MNARPQTPPLVSGAMRRPRAVLVATALVTVVAAVMFVNVRIDTDPENMLPGDDPVRVRNALLEEEFGAGPMIVAGFVTDDDIGTSERLDALIGLHRAVVALPDVVAEQSISVASVATGPPGTQADADALVAAVANDPVLGGNAISEDGRGAALFFTLVDKDVAAEVADDIDELIAADPVLAPLEHHIAGLPLAEDAFGQQMFVQMAIFAPLAGLLVFAIMLFFFRRLVLVLPAMAVAMVTVIVTMGALIGTGFTLHIMSSMIPIFLMPIAILDSVHVLSEFFDRHRAGASPAETLGSVLAELHRPITFTSLTTGVAFAALALTPIPPVRVFGVFVALGVAVAWLATMTFLPAVLVTIRAERLAPATIDGQGRERIVHRVLPRLGRVVIAHRGAVVGGFALIALVALPFLATISVNDNPVRWFRSGHEVRVATERLNTILPGTFTANVVLTADDTTTLAQPETTAATERFTEALAEHEDVGAVQSYVDAPTPAFLAGDRANIRVQLTSGDNTVMGSVVDLADEQLRADPIPGVDAEWAGEAYLNLRWQEKMVTGMLTGFVVTLVVVFALLVALFRSVRWALIAVLPVLWTVVVVYGYIGLTGRDYDMPIAVLSTLVLGIGVDFAIHFVDRFRQLHAASGSSREAIMRFFGEPSRALTRNAVVIAVGFTPLFLSSLVPYLVVGAFLASIIGLSWLATIVVLPAVVSLTDRDPSPATST